MHSHDKIAFRLAQILIKLKDGARLIVFLSLNILEHKTIIYINLQGCMRLK